MDDNKLRWGSEIELRDIIRIISLGECIRCRKRIRIKNFHIPLCYDCRLDYLEEAKTK